MELQLAHPSWLKCSAESPGTLEDTRVTSVGPALQGICISTPAMEHLFQNSQEILFWSQAILFRKILSQILEQPFYTNSQKNI